MSLLLLRAIAHAFPAIAQLVEAGRIDLILRDHDLGELAFIEFKFYVRRPRPSTNGGPTRWFKGGPSDKNLREFTQSIDRLALYPGERGLGRFIVAFYADPSPNESSTRRFGDYLDRYEHPLHPPAATSWLPPDRWAQAPSSCAEASAR